MFAELIQQVTSPIGRRYLSFLSIEATHLGKPDVNPILAERLERDGDGIAGPPPQVTKFGALGHLEDHPSVDAHVP